MSLNVTYICTGTSPSIWKKLGSDVATGTTKVAVLQDVRTRAQNGGTATAANWHGRRLNTKHDTQNFVTLLSTLMNLEHFMIIYSNNILVEIFCYFT